jgi:hypothetical protein
MINVMTISFSSWSATHLYLSFPSFRCLNAVLYHTCVVTSNMKNRNSAEVHGEGEECGRGGSTWGGRWCIAEEDAVRDKYKVEISMEWNPVTKAVLVRDLRLCGSSCAS